VTLAAAAPHRDFTRHDAKTLGLAALGGALEFYDFVVFVFFTRVLGELFFPPGTAPWLAQLQVYGIFAAGYLARPLGGIVMAHFGDRGGRKRMFTLSVLLMAVPTLLIGLLPTYAQIGVLAPLLLLVLRIVQGIAVGGEVPGAWVFVAEHVPANRIGFACASLTAGLTAGILIGSLLATWINTAFTPAEVSGGLWRVPFLLGGAFGLFAVFLRRWLQETPVFIAMQARRELVQGLPVRTVLAGHGGAVLRCILASWLLTAAIVVGVLLTPNLVQAAFQLPAGLAFQGGSIATAALILGCLLSGWAVDRYGVAVTLLLGSLLLLAAIYLLYWPLAQGQQAGFLWHYGLLGLSIGVTGAVPSLLIHAFPPSVRFSGVSFSYNVAYALFGAMTPPLVAWLAQRLGPLAPAHYVAFTSVIGVFLSVWMLSRRTAPA